MTLMADKLYKKALKLTEQERAELAAKIIDSLDSEEEVGVEAAWLIEVERRMQELDSGAVHSIPWEEVRNNLY